jgi:hypothetical protein
VASQDSKLAAPLANASAEANPSGEKAPAASPRSGNSDHYYEMLLGLCERLFENEIEQHLFEDQIRGIFGLKVRGGRTSAYSEFLTPFLRSSWRTKSSLLTKSSVLSSNKSVLTVYREHF